MSNYEQVTPDGEIMKVKLSPGFLSKPPPKWKKGTKAYLYFQVYSVPLEGEKAARLKKMEKESKFSGSKNPSIPDKVTASNGKVDLSRLAATIHSQSSCHHSSHSHSEKCDSTCQKNAQDAPLAGKANTGKESKPSSSDPRFERVLLADNRRYDSSPLELLVHRSFTFTGMENAIKSMRIGETAKFFMSSKYCEGFITLERALRKERKKAREKAMGLPPSAEFTCSMGLGDDFEENEDLYKSTCLSLEVNIELVDVVDPESCEQEPWELSIPEKLEEVKKRKDAGGEHYRLGQFEKASQDYHRCICLLESTLLNPDMLDKEHERQHLEWKASVQRDREKMEEARLRRLNKLPQTTTTTDINDTKVEERVTSSEKAASATPTGVKDLLTSCRLNYAACMIKQQAYDKAIIQCSEVLKSDSKNPKALYRRAQAYLRIGRDLDLAKNDLDSLILNNLLDKESYDYKKEEAILLKKLQEADRKERNMFTGLFR